MLSALAGSKCTRNVVAPWILAGPKNPRSSGVTESTSSATPGLVDGVTGLRNDTRTSFLVKVLGSMGRSNCTVKPSGIWIPSEVKLLLNVTPSTVTDLIGPIVL